jgi:hypothetical protein
MNDINFEEYLKKYGTLTYRNVGTSMMPLIKQGRDIFTLVRKGEARCKKYDVVLYRRSANKYIMHRIIEVRENDYVILGDNCISKEYGITDDDIIGVMTEFVRKGKKYTVDDNAYKCYVKIWCSLSGIRILLKKAKINLKRLIKK